MTDYEAGDVVLHTPFTVSILVPAVVLDGGKGTHDAKIHASTMNYDPDNVIRVGTDLRFVDASKPWDTVSGTVTLNLCMVLMLQSGGTRIMSSMMEFEPLVRTACISNVFKVRK